MIRTPHCLVFITIMMTLVISMQSSTKVIAASAKARSSVSRNAQTRIIMTEQRKVAIEKIMKESKIKHQKKLQEYRKVAVKKRSSSSAQSIRSSRPEKRNPRSILLRKKSSSSKSSKPATTVKKK